jgi:hypothetical protein
VWSATAAIGVILLTGYAAVRRRQRRRGPGSRPREPRRAELFPAVAACFFGALALGLLVLNLSRTHVFFVPGLGVVACLALAVGYAFRVGRALLRKG